MVENRSSLFGIIAIIIGASGLGLGAFSIVNFKILEGPEGPQGIPGNDGQDGIDGNDGVDGINGTDGIIGINGTDGIDGINGTLDNLVGVWESLYCNCTIINSYQDKIRVDDIRVNKSEYFYLSDSNTTFNFLKAGWYRFTLRFFWWSIKANEQYVLKMRGPSGLEETLEWLSSEYDNEYNFINPVVYAYCDIGNFVYFYCYTPGTDQFEIRDLQRNNQLVLEYVGE